MLFSLPLFVTNRYKYLLNTRPNPKFSVKVMKLITVEAYYKGISKIDIIRESVMGRFNLYPQERIDAMLRQYDKLTDEQKKHPEK